MSRARSIAGYSLLRLALFAVPFLVVRLLGGNPLVAAVVAAIAGVCLSVIFLPRQRHAMATAIGERADRTRARRAGTTDEDAEDAAVEAGPAEDAARAGDATGGSARADS